MEHFFGWCGKMLGLCLVFAIGDVVTGAIMVNAGYAPLEIAILSGVAALPQFYFLLYVCVRHVVRTLRAQEG